MNPLLRAAKIRNEKSLRAWAQKTGKAALVIMIDARLKRYKGGK